MGIAVPGNRRVRFLPTLFRACHAPRIASHKLAYVFRPASPSLAGWVNAASGHPGHRLAFNISGGLCEAGTARARRWHPAKAIPGARGRVLPPRAGAPSLARWQLVLAGARGR
jgi:hypothetical protein